MMETNSIKDLQSIWEDCEKEVKRHKRKIVAIFVIICLFFGLLGFTLGRVSAQDFAWGSDAVFDEDMFAANDWYILYDEMANMLLDGGYDDYNYVAVCHDSSYWFNRVQYFCVCFCSDPIKKFGSAGQVYTEYPDSDMVFYWIDSYSHVVGHVGYGVSYHDTSLGLYRYNVAYSGSFQVPAFNNGTCWCNNDVLGSTTLVANLEFGLPDTRILECEPYIDEYGNTFIKVYAYPTELSLFGGVTITYTDTLGTFSQTFLSSDNIRLVQSGTHLPGTNGVSVYINPNLISNYKFTVTQVEYVAAGDYGTKVLSGLSWTFNEDPFPLGSGYDTVNYFNSYQTEYGGSTVVSAYTGTFYRAYLLSNSNIVVWYDDLDIHKTMFDIKFLCIPDFMWTPSNVHEIQGTGTNVSLEQYYKMFEQYDVIIVGLNELNFDALYGSGAYDDVQDFVDIPGVDPIAYLINLSTRYVNLKADVPNSNVDALTYQSNVGFIVTRNFYLKKIHYSLGDVDSRLLEFETKLMNSSDGVLTNLQNKLVAAYVQDNSFYNSVSARLDNISLALNGLDLGVFSDISDKLSRLIDYLDFDVDIDLSALARPWKDIFQIGKGLFDGSSFMWDSMLDSFGYIEDGLSVSSNYSQNVLENPTGTIPLFPTISDPILPLPFPTPMEIEVPGITVTGTVIEGG